MSNHIITKIAPQIRESLKKVSPDDNLDFSDVISWELQGRKYIHPISKWFLPIEVARYGIPVLAAVTSFVAYILIVWQRFKGVSATDWALIIVNSVLLIYTAGIGIQIRAHLQRAKEPKSQSSIIESNAATEQLIPADHPQLASHQSSKISSTLPPSSGGG